MSDAQWLVLEPLVEACRPAARVPSQTPRETLSGTLRRPTLRRPILQRPTLQRPTLRRPTLQRPILQRHENGARWRPVPQELAP